VEKNKIFHNGINRSVFMKVNLAMTGFFIFDSDTVAGEGSGKPVSKGKALQAVADSWCKIQVLHNNFIRRYLGKAWLIAVKGEL
jgi:hypothetical protein